MRLQIHSQCARMQVHICDCRVTPSAGSLDAAAVGRYAHLVVDLQVGRTDQELGVRGGIMLDRSKDVLDGATDDATAWRSSRGDCDSALTAKCHPHSKNADSWASLMHACASACHPMCAHTPAPERSPSMVNVLPVPVCPYAMIAALYPCISKGRNVDRSPQP